MQDYIKQFDTFDDFYAWLEADETDVVDGKSEELRRKQEFQRASIQIVRRRVPGDSLNERNKAMESVGYKQRMRMVYEELKNDTAPLIYNLTPLQKTQSIPVHWEFNQDEYDKLAKGHRSNWCVFLRDDIVHVCRIGGEEFYRFVINKTNSNEYASRVLQTYSNEDFYTSSKAHGMTDEKIERHRVDFENETIAEVAGLLSAYFNIKLESGKSTTTVQ